MTCDDMKLRKITLDLFDGGAAGDGAAAGTNGDNSGSSQPENTGGADGREAPDAGEEKTPEQRAEEFRALIRGDYKDQFAKETQEIINRRFKETKTLQETIEAQKPLLDMLASKYGVDAGDVDAIRQALESDEATWERAADEAGMDVESYKRLHAAEAELNRIREAQRQSLKEQLAQRQLNAWEQAKEELKKEYPDFDLKKEMENPAFVSMLKAGAPMRNVYESLHMNEIKEKLAQTVKSTTEKRVVDNIRAKGQRPSEGGNSAGVSVSYDVHKLTAKDRAELARRAERGEHVTFS